MKGPRFVSLSILGFAVTDAHASYMGAPSAWFAFYAGLAMLPTAIVCFISGAIFIPLLRKKNTNLITTAAVYVAPGTVSALWIIRAASGVELGKVGNSAPLIAAATGWFVVLFVYRLVVKRLVRVLPNAQTSGT